MKKKPNTPRSKVKNALRRLWLQSRERAQALKNAQYCCDICGIKQSRAKGREVYLNVHHREGVNWDGVVDLIFERLLHKPERYQVLCVECHKDKHKG